jgi:hypothetical protein
LLKKVLDAFQEAAYLLKTPMPKATPISKWRGIGLLTSREINSLLEEAILMMNMVLSIILASSNPWG